MKKKMLVITPISHINGLVKLLKKHFQLTILEDPSRKKVSQVIQKYEIIFTNPNMSKVFLSKEIMQKGKKLSFICTASTGTNHIDLDCAKKRNIKVLSLRNHKKIINKISSTAEHALALMLSKIRKITESNHRVGFFSENNYILKYLEPYILKKLKKEKILIISFEKIINNNLNGARIFVFYTQFFRELVFLTLKLKYLYSSTPDLNQTIFKKSKLSKCKYIYLQHTPVSLTMIYNENAYDAFDALQAINTFQFTTANFVQ